MQEKKNNENLFSDKLFLENLIFGKLLHIFDNNFKFKTVCG